MSDYMKITIRIIISLIITIALIFAYGFIIGGRANLMFYLIMIIVNSLLLIFSFGKGFLKEKITMDNKYIAIIMIAVVLSFCGSSFYQWANNVFDTKVVDTYESYIIDWQEGRQNFTDIGVSFNNPKGEEVFFNFWDNNSIFNPEYYDGDKVKVEEYDGAFGVKHYRLTVLERNNK